MELFFVSLIVIFFALLSSSRVALRFRRSRVFTVLSSGGWLPLFAGIAIQYAFSENAEEGVLLSARPLVMTALGWIGLMVGMQARRDVLRSLPLSVWRLSLVDAIVSSVAFGAIAYLMLEYWSDGTSGDSVVSLVEPAAMLAACGIGWSLETRSLTIEKHEGDAKAVSILRSSGSLGVIFAIACFGMIEMFAGLSQHGEWSFDPLGTVRVLLTTIALAFSMGFVGRYGLRLAGKNKAEQLVVFLGLVAFVAGTASRLSISPLFASMLTGIVIANLAGNDLRLFERFIFQAEPIVGAASAMLAGMLMEISIGRAELGLAFAIVALRMLVKPIVWRAASGPDGRGGRGWETVAPLRQGRLALALSVSLALVIPSEFSARILTVVVVAGIVCDLVTVLIIRFFENKSETEATE